MLKHVMLFKLQKNYFILTFSFLKKKLLRTPLSFVLSQVAFGNRNIMSEPALSQFALLSLEVVQFGLQDLDNGKCSGAFQLSGEWWNILWKNQLVDSPSFPEDFSQQQRSDNTMTRPAARWMPSKTIQSLHMPCLIMLLIISFPGFSWLTWRRAAGLLACSVPCTAVAQVQL